MSVSLQTPQSLPPAVAGASVEVPGPAGVIRMQVAGDGPPALLVHSINAAASAAECAPVHAHLARTHRVYSPDLPGFGRSDRPSVRYTPALYVDALTAVLARIAADDSTPVHAVGLSLGGELLARTARAQPERFASLTLATPTGFDRRAARKDGPPGSTLEVAWLRRFLEQPRVGAAAFGLLARDSVIRYFLKRTMGDDEVDADLLAYACQTVRVEGARHAPLAFLSAGLFGRDAQRLYRDLEGPVWLAQGTRGDFADFAGAHWVDDTPGWQRTRFDSGAIPWYPAERSFVDALDCFLAGSTVPARA